MSNDSIPRSIVMDLVDGLLCCLKKDARYDLVSPQKLPSASTSTSTSMSTSMTTSKTTSTTPAQLLFTLATNNQTSLSTSTSTSSTSSPSRIIAYRKETRSHCSSDENNLIIHIHSPGDTSTTSTTSTQTSSPPLSMMSTTIWQPRVLKQVKNDSCGYYSLFNGISAYKACVSASSTSNNDPSSGSDNDSLHYFNRMLCRPLFWHIYSICMNLLLVKCRAAKKSYYPWNEKYIVKGVMERCYIDYLLESDNVLSRQRYPITVLPDWAIDSLRNNRISIEEINELREVSKRFKERQTYSHVFMLGVAVHWISIVINKVNANEHEIILMDSRNHDLLNGTDEHFQSIVDKHPEVPERLRKGYLLSLKDPKFIVKILQDCIIGEKDIVKEIIDINLNGFLDNYYSLVHPINDFASLHESLDMTDVKMVQLIHWLENYWPPSVIEHNICQVLDCIIKSKDDIHTVLDKKTLDSFSKWTKELSSHSLHSSNVHLLKRFSTTIEWFNGKFGFQSKRI
ncbi:hypothetical protein SAMD00019534_076140 [Acytostelium subglobosum LB1]|uniref:hypothetical protein n=1 Tax=Acytostelium subglobosum LB1 TaxID=1410327 RepID=UPI000644E0AD|nr:hypothetical protein SAMD00019534_076140 [Acytostelium subglobosum LB1]GAM24439.1 hypothetical protein SAMD00019534_076140 [Acytostelium subglobosum LB1]|eukprot:XP_012752765.1 hypothetical protein SAMD00019534_076140 [Acytostelium subglobosum LB1]